MNGSSADTLYTLLSCVISLVVLGGLITLAVFLVKKSREASAQTELMFSKFAQNLPQDKQGIFMVQYNNVRKNATTAVLLALFLGGVGAHKFYLGQIGWGVVYLLFSWTLIPGIVALIEAFSLPLQVNKHNQKKMREIYLMLGGR